MFTLTAENFSHETSGDHPDGTVGEGFERYHEDGFTWVNIVTEYAPARRYCIEDPVVSIGGQRYRLTVAVSEDPEGVPAKVAVTFAETDEPETPYETHVRGYNWLQVFGKPLWVQEPMLVERDGKAAPCLMVLDTGWGDGGNVNILFATDANGKPDQIWMEASCS